MVVVVVTRYSLSSVDAEAGPAHLSPIVPSTESQRRWSRDDSLDGNHRNHERVEKKMDGDAVGLSEGMSVGGRNDHLPICCSKIPRP